MGVWMEGLEERAASVLAKPDNDFVAGAAGREDAVAANLAAWRSMKLYPHVLRDVSEISTTTTVLGTTVDVPVFIAPMGAHTVVHEEGEVETARGAAAGGALFAVPERGAHSLEAVIEAAGGRGWFQIYVQADRAYTRAIVKRAEAAGYGAIIVTVDATTRAARYRDISNGYARPAALQRGNVRPETADSFSTDTNGTVTIRDIEELVSSTSVPIVVKGVLRPDDARRCVEAGAQGVIVSNHGGRQLESAVPTATALPAIVEAIGQSAEVYVDGGVRCSDDVVKALALGARGVFVGRPVLWALASEGAAGVAKLFTEFRDDVNRTMAVCGARNIGEITRDLVLASGSTAPVSS